MVVLQIMGDALGGRVPPIPTYVRDCDFEVLSGVIFTQNRDRAKQFENAEQALEYWRTQSKTNPLRPDGKPNRPLTAYTVTVLKEGADPL
jgi:hypothetical protein